MNKKSIEINQLSKSIAQTLIYSCKPFSVGCVECVCKELCDLLIGDDMVIKKTYEDIECEIYKILENIK